MKKSNSFLLITLLASAQLMTLSPEALAQKGANTVITPVAGIINPAKPGQYTIQQISENRNSLIRELSKIDAQNQKTIEALVKDIEKSFIQLAEEVNLTGIRKLSDDSLSSDTKITLDQYLSAKRKFDQVVIVLDSKINLLKSLKDNTAKLSTSDSEVSLSERTRFHIEKIAVSFEDQKKMLIEDTNKLTVIIYSKTLGANIEQIVGESLNEELRKEKFGAKNAEELRKAAMIKMTANEQQKTQLKGYTQFLLSNISSIVKTYGSSEVYRATTDSEGLRKALDSIYDMMTVRSYLRVKYAMPLGVLAVKHTKETLNTDLIDGKMPLEFVQIGGLDANAQALRIQAKNLLQNSLIKNTLKSQDVFGEGVSFGARILSAINTMQGKKPWAVVNTAILKLLMQDIEEEMLLSDVEKDGTLLVRENFKIRFTKTEADKIQSKAVADKIEKVLSGKIPSSGNGADANSVLLRTSVVLKNLRDLRSEAFTMLMLADEMNKDSDAEKEENERTGDLFN